MTDILLEFSGPNAGYILELFERYLADPTRVDDQTRVFFQQNERAFRDLLSGTQLPVQPLSATEPVVSPGPAAERVAAIARLASAVRNYGHMAARLDPLGAPPPGDPWLDLAFHGISEIDLRQIPAEVVGGPAAAGASTAFEAMQNLYTVYAGASGYEYNHIRIPEERDWLRQAAEAGEFRPPKDPIDVDAVLNRLSHVEAFEQFLHRTFPGKTRFSIEGQDMLVPMLDELLACAGNANICTAVIGMAHRGRLNILAHILGKPYAQILAEFKDPLELSATRNELGWLGDVKYHKGARLAVQDDHQVQLIVSMPPNPSHLEHIDPVVVGMARAAGSKVDQPGAPVFFSDACLPVLIHGDAAFPGQGIVSETLNFSRLPGYWTGGTIHIISNNQLGYTTPASAGRSTIYASDLAKGFQIPIIHVNADEPAACLEAIRTAFAYRQKFNKDFLIDLIGYRRYGHNEGDEPSFTQPVMYQQIEQHPSVRKLWGEQLVKTGQAAPETVDRMITDALAELERVFQALDPGDVPAEPQLEPPPPGAARRVVTTVPLEELRSLNEALLQVPEGFAVNRKLERVRQRRKNVFDDPDQNTIDWATAEELAFASLLAEKIPIRLTGEDVARGTFSQRHAELHDAQNGKVFTPLQSLPQAKASFEVINSALSENAALGFEFGYNIQAPNRLVVWEAQYGDFINTAQAVLDEFLLSGRAKWEQTPSMVLLLPHGHEGQGPDHSSARPERFLQLAVGLNLRLVNCTTAAQYFHVLRRQALLLGTDPLPLIVLTPKSLLRNPQAASSPREFAEGAFLPVLDDPLVTGSREGIRRLVLCSGKVYFDLLAAGKDSRPADLAILRLEQIYPFPGEAFTDLLTWYPRLEKVNWVQEEPANMGAWNFVKDQLRDLLPGELPVEYTGRPASSSPAEGSTNWHHQNQKTLVNAVFEPQTWQVEEGKTR